jgi:hypothetical protein
VKWGSQAGARSIPWLSAVSADLSYSFLPVDHIPAERAVRQLRLRRQGSLSRNPRAPMVRGRCNNNSEMRLTGLTGQLDERRSTAQVRQSRHPGTPPSNRIAREALDPKSIGSIILISVTGIKAQARLRTNDRQRSTCDTSAADLCESPTIISSAAAFGQLQRPWVFGVNGPASNVQPCAPLACLPSPAAAASAARGMPRMHNLTPVTR